MIRRYLICCSFLLLAFVQSAPFLFAQSISKEEEALRKELLTALKDNAITSPEQLKRFYLQPKQTPFRTQKFVDQDAAIALGRKLFFDQRLSRDTHIACSSCHMPEKFWTDGKAESTEGNSRRSMALFNLAWDSCFTWRCQAGTLMSQAILAMTAPKGMAANVVEIAANVRKVDAYKPFFEQAFPKHPQPISPEGVAAAIEYYVASLRSAPAPFDRWVEGDEKAISERAKHGFLVFHTKAPCAQCHNLWRFSDSRRYDIGVTHISEDREPLYKSVGLREIADRPPYFHDGSLHSLDQVLAFYMRGGDANRETKSKLIKPFSLSLNDQTDLILFLKTLSSGPVKEGRPELPR